MQKAQAPARKSLTFNKNELKDVSIVISDVDYTLLDFDKGHQAGLSALAKAFGSDFSQEVDKMFNLILEGFRRPEAESWEKRSEFNYLISRVGTLRGLSDSGLNVWSREILIILAAEKIQIHLTKEDVEAGRNAYWAAVSNEGTLYADAEIFLSLLQRLGLPLILMAGSDHILRINDNLKLTYEPIFSEEYKRKRLQILPIHAQGIVIGDPIDKPDPRFFDKLFEEVRKIGDFRMRDVLVIGDSERNDLEGPRRLGCQTLLIKRS